MDEESTKSDEEYDDLAMQDDGYLSDDDEELNSRVKPTDVSAALREQSNPLDLQQKMDLFQRAKSEPLPDSLMRAFAPFRERNERKVANFRLRKRSQSINH